MQQLRIMVGDWLIIPERNVISDGEREIRLEPKIMEVLLILAQEPGAVVSKERMIAGVWGETFVTDQVLTNAIWELRKALGDDAKSPNFIQTVPKKGYRLIAPVFDSTAFESKEVGLTLAGRVRSIDKFFPVSRRRTRIVYGIIILLIVLSGPIIRNRNLNEQLIVESPSKPRQAAHEAYTKGLDQFKKRTPASLRDSLRHFEEAVRLDSNYAPAQAALAANYILLVPKVLPPLDGYPKAQSAARRALESDPRLSEAHSAMGMIKLVFERDWAGAERSFQQAIDFAPDNAFARVWYAQFLWAANRLSEAGVQIENACQLEPDSIGAQITAGEIFWRTGHDDKAMIAYQRVLGLDPHHIQAHQGLGNVYRKKQLLAQASSEYQKALELMGEPAAASLGRAFAYAKKTEPQLLMSKLNVLLKQKNVPPSRIAQIFAGFNDRDKAFYWLEKGFAEWDTGLLLLQVDDSWDNLRGDPRFTSLVQRVGIVN